MNPADFATLREAVKLDEAFRATPYDDATGTPLRAGDTLKGQITIGWGTNLSAGITQAWAAQMLEDRLQGTVAELTHAHPVLLTLSPARQIVLANIAYNIGVPSLNAFKLMWLAIARGDFQDAAAQMRNSTWASEVGRRAERLAIEMENG